MEQNKDKGAYILGTVVLGGASAGLTGLLRREYERHSRLEPTEHDIETAQTSALLAHQQASWDEIYLRARQRAQGAHTIEMAVMAAGLVTCAYGAYRSLRRIFR